MIAPKRPPPSSASASTAPRKPPASPLFSATIAQRRLLGLGAVLGRVNRARFEVLGGTHRGAAATLRRTASAGMHTKDAACTFLERALVDAENSAHPARDLGRAVSWAGDVYVAGLLEAGEAWDFVVRAAQAVDRVARLSSWEAFGADYLAGGASRDGSDHGRPQKRKDAREEAEAVEWLLRSKKSPWVTVPWDTPHDDAPPSVHSARVLRVRPGAKRGSYPTIAEALLHASDGDVVSIAPGVYAEAVRPEVDVTLIAERVPSRTRKRATESLREPVAMGVEIVAHDHALFIAGASVRASGIRWRGTRDDRSTISVRDSGVLRLDGSEVESASHGVSVLDDDTLAILEDVVVSKPASIGVTVWNGASLRATRVTIEAPKIGLSVEKKGTAELDLVTVSDAREVALLVVGKKARAKGRALSFENAAWSGIQVSKGGHLSLRDSSVLACETGILIQAGRLELAETRVLDSRANGLELHEGATAFAHGLVVERTLGSAIFVAEGSELSLSRATLDTAGVDGVTCKGELSIEDAMVKDATRGAFWLEDGALAVIRRSVTVGGRVGARIGIGARLAVESTSFTRPTLGIATDGGIVALESTFVADAVEHALQVNGGELCAGYLTVEGQSEHSVFVSRGLARIISSRLESAGEVHVNGADARLELRRSTVSTKGAVGCALHAGQMTLSHCRVESGGNGVEGISGSLLIDSSSIEGTECGLVLAKDVRAHVTNGALVATNDVAIELLGAAHAELASVSLVAGREGVSRAAKTATLAEEPARERSPKSARKPSPWPSFSPDLDGEGVLPFELGLHAGPTYVLFTSDLESALFPCAEAFVATGLSLDGAGFETWSRALIEVAAERSLPESLCTDLRRLCFDPETSSVAVTSVHRETLVAFARLVRVALADAALMEHALAAAVRPRPPEELPGEP